MKSLQLPRLYCLLYIINHVCANIELVPISAARGILLIKVGREDESIAYYTKLLGEEEDPGLAVSRAQLTLIK